MPAAAQVLGHRAPARPHDQEGHVGMAVRPGRSAARMKTPIPLRPRVSLDALPLKPTQKVSGPMPWRARRWAFSPAAGGRNRAGSTAMRIMPSLSVGHAGGDQGVAPLVADGHHRVGALGRLHAGLVLDMVDAGDHRRPVAEAVAVLGGQVRGAWKWTRSRPTRKPPPDWCSMVSPAGRQQARLDPRIEAPDPPGDAWR